MWLAPDCEIALPTAAVDNRDNYSRAIVSNPTQRVERRRRLAIAHTRAEDGEQRPFGSVFWHNLARSTWFLKRVGEQAAPNLITLGVFHRKANFGPLRPPFGIELALENAEDQTLSRVMVRRVNIADVGELATSLPLWQRMKHALRAAPSPSPALRGIGRKARHGQESAGTR